MGVCLSPTSCGSWDDGPQHENSKKIPLDNDFLLWYNRRMKKKITVDLTLSWTFDEKEWSDEKAHIAEMMTNPNIVLGYDIIHSIYCLNDIRDPELKEVKTYAAN